MSPLFSERTAIDRRPHPFARALARARAAGRPLTDLTVSNPTRVGLPPLHGVLEALASPESLRYDPDPLGLPAAREHLGRVLRADPTRIVLAAGTSELYGWLFQLLCDPGDEILVPAPSYPLLDHLAHFASVRLRPYRLQWAEGWFVDHESLRESLSPRSRAILLVRPNNPTGSYPNLETWRQFARTGLPVICDEVFLSYPLTREARGERSAAELVEALGLPLLFALDGLSKRCGMPQFKLSWMRVEGCDRAAVTEAIGRLELLADAHLSLGTVPQVALPRLLEAGATRREAIAARLHDNLTAARGRAREAPFDLLPPEGGWYIVLRLPASRSEEAWMLAALEAGLVLHPGWFYDADPSMGPLAVLSLLTPPSEFDEGLERLGALCTHG